jgi:hypothetical protein
MYHPVSATLDQILSNEQYQGSLMETKRSSLAFDEIQACVNAKKLPPGKKPLNLQMCAFFDDLEVTNPVGSHTKVHKLSVIYFILTNLPPDFRSQLTAVHVLAISKCKYITQETMNFFLLPFVTELKLYHSGVCMGDFYVTIHLIAFIGDTPAISSVLGFKEGVSFARRFCRLCMCSEVSDFSCHPLRCKAQHNIMCNRMRRDEADRTLLSTEYGINFQSVLADVPCFDIFANTPFDIMHIILEGTLERVMRNMLNKTIYSLKLISLLELNNLISSFPYKRNSSKNKPSIILRSHLQPSSSIKQSASQMSALAHLLPLIFCPSPPR